MGLANALVVTGHHLGLLPHVLINLGCVYTGPLTQAGILKVKWELWRHEVHTSQPVLLLMLRCAVVQLAQGHVQRGIQSTFFCRLGPFRGGDNYRSR